MSNVQRVAVIVIGMSVLAGCSTTVNDLSVGDCFNGPDVSYRGGGLGHDPVDCNEPHDSRCTPPKR